MTAWLFNLDADQELAHGAGYTTPRRVAAKLRPHAAALALRTARALAARVGRHDVSVRAVARAHKLVVEYGGRSAVQLAVKRGSYR